MPVIDQRGAPLDLSLNVGDDWALTVNVTENSAPWVAAGATIASVITDRTGRPAPVASFTTAAADGSLTVSLNDTQTTLLGVDNYRYAIEVTKAGQTRTWLAGELTVSGATTPGRSPSTIGLSITSGTVSLLLTSLIAPAAASTANQGLVELATNAEALARTDAVRAVTPANLATTGPFPGAYGAGRWVVVAGVTGASAAAVDGKLCLVPFRAVAGRTLDRIGLTISTLGAGSLVRLGIYADDGNGYPDLTAAPQDFGTVDSSTTGAKSLAINYVVPSPIIWLAAVSQGGTPPSWNSTGGGISWQWADVANASFSAAGAAYQKTGVTGALPALSSVILQSPAAAPMLYVRYT